jgi:F-type H+-transporting ATPase subunit c
MISPELLHYGAAAISILLGAMGAGIGLGIAGLGIEEVLIRQPAGHAPSFRAMYIGLALIESGAIIALVATLLTLFSKQNDLTYAYVLAELGASLAVGVAAFMVCIASSFVVKGAVQSIAREPMFASKIIGFMLVAQSIVEAPVIFAFIVALLVRTNLVETVEWFNALRLFASGLTMALGCIGPSLGQGIFSYAACKSIGINKSVYGKLFPYALINQAVIETPMIFCLLFSLIMLYMPLPQAVGAIGGLKCLVGACIMGIGALGASIGISYVASRGCYQMALDPTIYALIGRTTLVTAALIESSVIYALIIALLLVR